MPDRAIVYATIEGEGSSRDAAYSEAQPFAARVDEVIAAHGPAIGRNTTAALVVHPKTRWRKGEAIRTGWRASRSSELEVVTFARLGDLFAELAAAGATVTGPRWQLDSANPVYAQVRQRAAQDARARADSYAAGLGVRVRGVAWAAEPGLRLGDDTHPGGMVAMAMAREGGLAEEEVIDVTPAEMTVTAELEVAFDFEG